MSIESNEEYIYILIFSDIKLWDMRKMLTIEELDAFNSVAAGNKISGKAKSQISKMEEKSYTSITNQYTVLFTRYKLLQEQTKMSSKHNTSKNLLFGNIANLDNSQKNPFKTTVEKNATLDLFAFNKTKSGNTSNSINKNPFLQNIKSKIDAENEHRMKEMDNKIEINSHFLKKGMLNMPIQLNENNNHSNMSTFSMNRELEEEQELKNKIKEIKGRKNIKGLTSMSINREHNKILVNSMSNSQFLYDPLYFDKYQPLELKGHSSSYFVKSVLSPNAEYALSGSSDATLYIWDIPSSINNSQSNLNNNPIRLTGFHKNEV